MKTNRMTMLIMSAVIGTAAMAQPQSSTTEPADAPVKCQEAPPAGGPGCAGAFKGGPVPCGRGMGKHLKGQKPTAEEMAKRNTERMTKKLDLTPAQQEAIGKMNLKNARRHEKMHAKMMKKHAKRMAKGKKRMSKQDAQLKRILTADQYQKLQQMREEKMKKMGCKGKGEFGKGPRHGKAMGHHRHHGKGMGRPHHHRHHGPHMKGGPRPEVKGEEMRPAPDATTQPVVPQAENK